MNLTKLFINDIIKASDLSDRLKDIFIKRLNDIRLTDIAKEYGITRQRVDQMEKRAISELKHPARLGLSYRGYKVKMYEEPKGAVYKTITAEEMDKTSIEVLDLPKKIINALALSGVLTIGEAKKRNNLLYRIKNLGPRSIEKLKEELRKYYGNDII